ncbi:hypothetical protein B0H34DRAFT_662937 [Crassisporium funariophilum]|nr:hypothetical protein B0H34DRAFT_662937 [Crassisporium funariophilum]
MSNRRHIHKAVKEQLVFMAARMKSCAIAHVTGVSQRTVNRVIRLKRLTGSVVRVPFAAGRPRLLNGIDASYLESLIKRTPDLLLTELQSELQECRKINVSTQVIHNTLRRRGFTWKQVSSALTHFAFEFITLKGQPSCSQKK